MSDKPTVCEHGSIKYKCEICERDDEIAQLRARVRELERNNAAPGAHTIQRVVRLEDLVDQHRERVRELEDALDQVLKHTGASGQVWIETRKENKQLRARVEELEEIIDAEPDILWRNYANTPDDKLTPKAQELKQALRKIAAENVA